MGANSPSAEELEARLVALEQLIEKVVDALELQARNITKITDILERMSRS